MFPKPDISVIMPVHNAGKYLHEAVKSILYQYSVSLELILIDDHSTDDAIQSLPDESKIDPRLKIVSAKGKGVVNAMREGVTRARGRFYARMDADDIASPNRLLTQLNYLQSHAEVGIVGAQVRIISDTELGQGYKLYQDWLNKLNTPTDIARELYIESPIPNPTAMFRREVYQQLGGYDETEWAEDYDMWLRADASGIKMGKPDGILLDWRDHSGRLTRTDERYSNDLFLKAKAYFLSKRIVNNQFVSIWGTGPTGIRIHDLLISYGVTVKAFIEVHPRRIGRQKRGLPVLPVDKISNLKETLIIGAVGARGARHQIRTALIANGMHEGQDFLFAA